MPNIRAIHATNNRIRSISENVSTFPKLQSLRLNDNQIYKLPNFDELELIELDIRNNRLQKLPHVAAELVKFEIDGNYSNSTGPFLGNEYLKRGKFRKIRTYHGILDELVDTKVFRFQVQSKRAIKIGECAEYSKHSG